MKKLLLLIICIPSILLAQNLVPNPSFELVDSACVENATIGANGLIECASPWFQPAEESTSDLHFNWFTNLESNEHVRTGSVSARIGVFDDLLFSIDNVPNFDSPREYIEVGLSDSLETGIEYVISMYVYSVYCSAMTNGLGAYFSADSILYSNVDFLQTPWDPSLCPLNEQVHLSHEELLPPNEWYHFKKSFVAQGGEKFMTIGNFITDEELSFITDFNDCWGYTDASYSTPEVLLIDDIAVFPLGSFQAEAYAGNDTTVCVGETLNLGSHNYPDYSYTWLDDNGISYDGAYLDVTPTQTTSYILTVKDNFFIETFDTLTVYVDDCIEYSANAGEDTTICLGESLVLEDIYYPNYQYQWTDDNGSLWAGASIEVSPSVSTNYYLQVQEDLAELSYDTVWVSVQDCEESIHEINTSKIKLHPNPASSIVQIESPYFIRSWKLLNSIGKDIQVSKAQEENAITLDVSSLEAGLYFVDLNVEGVSIVKQLIVE